MFKHSISIFKDLQQFVKTNATVTSVSSIIREDEDTKGFLWSHELGLSASEYM